jgi:hypothetical protein
LPTHDRDWTLHARRLFRVAYAKFELEEWRGVVAFCERARQAHERVAPETRDLDGIVEILSEQAFAHEHLGELERSLELLLEACATFERIPPRQLTRDAERDRWRSYARTIERMALLHEELGDWPSALAARELRWAHCPTFRGPSGEVRGAADPAPPARSRKPLDRAQRSNTSPLEGADPFQKRGA